MLRIVSLAYSPACSVRIYLGLVLKIACMGVALADLGYGPLKPANYFEIILAASQSVLFLIIILMALSGRCLGRTPQRLDQLEPRPEENVLILGQDAGQDAGQ